MQKKPIVIVLALSAISILGGYLFNQYLERQSWQLISSKESPDGRYKVIYYFSHAEKGHAPYGSNLLLSSARHSWKKSIEETFFAGYCEGALDYNWEGDSKIIIRCGKGSDLPRTVSSVVRGIQVTILD